MSCPRFIAESFALRTAAHMAHLTVTNGDQHRALGDFYEELLDLVDQYAEVYMGLTARIDSFPNVQVPRGNIVTALEDYLESVREEFKEDNGSESLKNILAELEALTARTLYKLRNLK